jgi:hypothetical protein
MTTELAGAAAAIRVHLELTSVVDALDGADRATLAAAFDEFNRSVHVALESL